MKSAPSLKPTKFPIAVSTTVAALASSGITILATTQSKPKPQPVQHAAQQAPAILPASLPSELSDTSIDWQHLTLTGFDANGELVELILDYHALAIFDAWPTGPGDASHNGIVDLADLNLVLAFMGTDYRPTTEPDGEPTP